MSVYEEKVEFVVICFCTLTAPRVKCLHVYSWSFVCILPLMCDLYVPMLANSKFKITNVAKVNQFGKLYRIGFVAFYNLKGCFLL